MRHDTPRQSLTWTMVQHGAIVDGCVTSRPFHNKTQHDTIAFHKWALRRPHQSQTSSLLALETKQIVTFTMNYS